MNHRDLSDSTENDFSEDFLEKLRKGSSIRNAIYDAKRYGQSDIKSIEQLCNSMDYLSEAFKNYVENKPTKYVVELDTKNYNTWSFKIRFNLFMKSIW